MIRPSAFTDPDVLRREREGLFRESWLLLSPRDPAFLRVRGARAPVDLLGSPLFLQRGFDGILRLFPNVCTHAWHTLVRGPERQKTAVCAQHGRSFDCEGRYLSQPGFTGKGASLRPIPLEEWKGLPFACLGKPTLPFRRLTAPVEASLGGLDPASFRPQPLPESVREVDGNWKQHAWNYMDRLHIPFLHRSPRGLADAIDLDSYRTELHPGCALQWAYARDPASGFEPSLLPKRFRQGSRRVFALWWLLFPNLALNFYPWGLSVNVYEPVAGRPDRTRFLWSHFVLDERKYAERDARWLNRQVDDEDVEAMRQVLAGIRSGLARPVGFSKEEAGPAWFFRSVEAKAHPRVLKA